MAKTCKKDGCSFKVFGGGYCKSHQHLRTDLKKKQSRDWEEMRNFFISIWMKKPHICESCDEKLGEEPLSIYFDHLLEKSLYPEFALEEKNIYIVCLECHSCKTNGFPKPKHKKAIENAKKLLLND